MTSQEAMPRVGESRSLENPATPMTDADIFDDPIGTSRAGKRVSYDTSLTYAAIWRAVNLISRDVAKLPLFVFERKGDGKDRARTHPAARLLRYKPNEFQTAFVFWFHVMGQALLRGNGYAYIVRNGKGEPLELVPLHHTTQPDVENGRLVFKGFTVFEDGNRERTFESRNVLHIKGYSSNGVTGDSVITRARESIGLGLAARDYGSAFFGNGARPGILLRKPEGVLSDEAAKRLKKDFERMHRGTANSWRTAVLEEGLEVETLGLSNDDAQFIESRAFEIREIANWFGVPPHKLGDDSRTSFASLEQENQAYLDDALDPWLVSNEQECRDKLLSLNQRTADSHVIEYERNALVRANLESRSSFYMSALQWGWMNRDEVRQRENMNPIPDGEGQKFMTPMNMTTTDEDEAPLPPSDPTPPDDDEEEEDDSASRVGLLVSFLQRHARRIMRQAETRAKEPDKLFGWLECDMERKNRGLFVDEIRPVCAVIGGDPDELAREFFQTVEDRMYEPLGGYDLREITKIMMTAAIRSVETGLEELARKTIR